MLIEQWRDIKGYERSYQISSIGRVKSLARDSKKPPFLQNKKEKILKPQTNTYDYYHVTLYKAGNKLMITIHQLVAMAFLKHIPNGLVIVVNHINFNRKDNRVENLEIITARQNSNQKHIKSSSKFVGVHWYKLGRKWSAHFIIKGKKEHLGYFESERIASIARNIAFRKYLLNEYKLFIT